jgi:hypothetical protein
LKLSSAGRERGGTASPDLLQTSARASDLGLDAELQLAEAVDHVVHAVAMAWLPRRGLAHAHVVGFEVNGRIDDDLALDARRRAEADRLREIDFVLVLRPRGAERVEDDVALARHEARETTPRAEGPRLVADERIPGRLRPTRERLPSASAQATRRLMHVLFMIEFTPENGGWDTPRARRRHGTASVALATMNERHIGGNLTARPSSSRRY